MPIKVGNTGTSALLWSLNRIVVGTLGDSNSAAGGQVQTGQTISNTYNGLGYGSLTIFNGL
jgi:hypothetical protein